jgi:hypothetical protein
VHCLDFLGRRAVLSFGLMLILCACLSSSNYCLSMHPCECYLLFLQEKLPVEQFIDTSVSESEPVKPADLDETPFTLVDDLKGLKELSKKLKNVTEFAVRICN